MTAERSGNEKSRIEIVTQPSTLDCYLDDRFTKSIRGVRVAVELNGNPVWERIERERFTTSIIGYAPKPFYERRIRNARKKAEKIARSLE